MRTDSILFHPFDVFRELQLNKLGAGCVRSDLPCSRPLLNEGMQHDLLEPAHSVTDGSLNRVADSVVSSIMADNRLDSFQDLLATLMALPDGFQEDRLLARAAGDAEGTPHQDASPQTGAGAETPQPDREPLFEAAAGASRNAEGETSDALTRTESNGLLGLVYSSGINEEGTEIVTLVLEEEDKRWNSEFSTISAGDIQSRIPTTALEFERNVCGITAGYSPTGSSRCDGGLDDGVFAAPSSVPVEHNTPLQFPRTRFGFQPQPDLDGNSPFSPSSSAFALTAASTLTPSPSYCSLSSGYSSMSSIATCLTPRSASTSSADYEDSSSAFSESALVDEDAHEASSPALLSEDDALALQRLNITPLVKENLKRAICKRRHDSGLPLLDVDNAPKAKVKKEMTAEERARYLKRREQNRSAATRFRQKQKDTADILTQKCRKLDNANTTLRTEIARLAQETAHLKQMLQAHLQICPTMAAMVFR